MSDKKKEAEKDNKESQLEESFRSFLDKSSKISRLLRLATSLTVTLGVFWLTVVILTVITYNKNIFESYFSKSIKADISKVIENQGDLSTIKHIYNIREVKKKSLTDLFWKKEGDFYPSSTSLTEILNDLKVDYYVSEKRNPKFLKSLVEIIKAHNQVNPFDKLDPNQKFAFENVRLKLDSNYILVQEDFNRIADELSNKNLLVDDYLGKSTLSYWISIVALALTIVLSTIQIYQNRNAGIESIVNKLLKEMEK